MKRRSRHNAAHRGLPDLHAIVSRADPLRPCPTISNMPQPSPFLSGSASCIATIRPSSSRRRGRKSSTPIPSEGRGGTKPPPSMSASHGRIRSLAIVLSFSPRRASRNEPTRSWPNYRLGSGTSLGRFKSSRLDGSCARYERSSGIWRPLMEA